ncbi:MAG: hypothetical protein DMF61_19980 [Blastocatellia bacterium AA13]|nr:MAG: hypothetical protein DMF61_19980 [Blastocatellia bacterium AA13]
MTKTLQLLLAACVVASISSDFHWAVRLRQDRLVEKSEKRFEVAEQTGIDNTITMAQNRVVGLSEGLSAADPNPQVLYVLTGQPYEPKLTQTGLKDRSINDASRSQPNADHRDKPKLVVQLGLDHSVFSCAFSPDGRLALTDGDKRASLWETQTGKLLRRFKADLSGLSIFSPDGRCALTGSSLPDLSYSTVDLWEIETGTLLRAIKVHGGLRAVAFSPDGKRLATLGPTSGTIWEVETGKPLLPTFKQQVIGWSAVFSPEGKYLLTGSFPVRMWDTETGDLVRTFETSALSTRGSIIFTPDGLSVLVWTEGRSAQIWDARTGVLKRQVKIKGATGGSVAFSPSGHYVITQNKDHIAEVWDVSSDRVLLEFKAQGGRDFTSFAFSQDEHYVMAGERSAVAQIWDLHSARIVCSLRGGDVGRIRSVGFSPNGVYLVTAGQDISAHLWNLRTGKEKARLGPDEFGYLSALFSPNGRYVLVCGWKSAQLWDAETGALVRRVERDSPLLTPAAFTRDVQRLAMRTGGRIGIWNVENGKLEYEFDQDQKLLYSLAFSKDGRYLLIGGVDDAQLREAQTGRLLRRLKKGQESFGYSAIFSPDDRYIITRSYTNAAVQFWDRNTGKLSRELEASEVPLSSVDVSPALAVSPHGRYMAVGADRTVELWDVRTGRRLSAFEGHDLPVTSVAFSPDNRYVVSGSDDNTARIWSVEAKKLLAQLVSLRDGNWVVVDSEGRFDASSLEYLKDLHWLMPDDPVHALQLELLLRDYYQPRLLARILSGERFAALPSVLELNRAQPKVEEIEVLPQDNEGKLVTVRVSVTSRTAQCLKDGKHVACESGVYDLRLYRDGVLVGQSPSTQSASFSQYAVGRSHQEQVQAWRESSMIRTEDGAPVSVASGPQQITFTNIQLPQRSNASQVAFTAYAFNADRVKSETSQPVIYALPKVRPAVRPKAYIITMGVDVTRDPNWRLPFASIGARAIEQLLRNKLSPEYDMVTVPLLSEYRNSRIWQNHAAKADLERALLVLSGHGSAAQREEFPQLRQATPDDLVMLYIASHGYADPNGTFYVVPSDVGGSGLVSEQLLDRCLKTGETSAACQEGEDFLRSSISSNELTQWMQGIDAGSMVLILDSCHSGAIPGSNFKPGPMGDRGFGQLSYDKRMLVLAASQPDGYERGAIRSDDRSLLTIALTEQPQQAAWDLREWLSRAERNVPGLTRKEFPGSSELQPTLFDFARTGTTTR